MAEAMMLIARFRRWCHLMAWLARPWRWNTLVHRAITYRCGIVTTQVLCACGKDFAWR